MNYIRWEISIFNFMVRNNNFRNDVIIKFSVDNSLSFAFNSIFFITVSFFKSKFIMNNHCNRFFSGLVRFHFRRNIIGIFIINNFWGRWILFKSIFDGISIFRGKFLSTMNLLFNSCWFSNFYRNIIIIFGFGWYLRLCLCLSLWLILFFS